MSPVETLDLIIILQKNKIHYYMIVTFLIAVC